VDPLQPFLPALYIVTAIASVIGGYIAFKKLQKADVKGIFNGEWEKRQKDFKQGVREIVSEAFTGRAEADAYFRAEVSSSYKTMLREALDDHSKDERKYIDTLRDRIVEYHVETKTAITDAKRLAIQVSGEYQHLLGRVRAVEEDLVKIHNDLQRLASKTV